MRNTIIIAAISLAVAGCSKDKFSSTPQLTFKSISTKELHKGENIQFKLSFTDLEGDLQDSIYVEKYAFNCTASRIGRYYKMPVFPSVKNNEGDVIVTLSYNGSDYPLIQPPQCTGDNDTCKFRFVLQDQAKHKSDTAESDIFIIYQ